MKPSEINKSLNEAESGAFFHKESKKTEDLSKLLPYRRISEGYFRYLNSMMDLKELFIKEAHNLGYPEAESGAFFNKNLLTSMRDYNVGYFGLRRK